MSYKEFEKYDNDSLSLCFLFGIPLVIIFGIFGIPILQTLNSTVAILIGSVIVYGILFGVPSVVRFIMRKVNPYITNSKEGNA